MWGSIPGKPGKLDFIIGWKKTLNNDAEELCVFSWDANVNLAAIISLSATIFIVLCGCQLYCFFPFLFLTPTPAHPKLLSINVRCSAKKYSYFIFMKGRSNGMRWAGEGGWLSGSCFDKHCCRELIDVVLVAWPTRGCRYGNLHEEDEGNYCGFPDLILWFPFNLRGGKRWWCCTIKL